MVPRNRCMFIKLKNIPGICQVRNTYIYIYMRTMKSCLKDRAILCLGASFFPPLLPSCQIHLRPLPLPRPYLHILGSPSPPSAQKRNETNQICCPWYRRGVLRYLVRGAPFAILLCQGFVHLSCLCINPNQAAFAEKSFYQGTRNPIKRAFDQITA